MKFTTKFGRKLEKSGTRGNACLPGARPYRGEWFEMDDGGAPGAEGAAGEVERVDVGAFFEEGVHGGTECADAFAMDDADVEDALLATDVEVIVDDVFDVARSEGMEIEDAVDWELDRRLDRLEVVGVHGLMED
jgi:hypothetical protein